MLNTKYAPWPKYDEDEIQAVEKVLRSGRVNYWTGELTKEFETKFAQYHQRKFGIALSNGTLALELALISFGIQAGDEVITTPRTYIASASCIVRLGARPVLADIDPISQNISADTIAKVITPKTKAIVVVHLGGWPADMPSIMSLASKHNLYVIEDCAQAHGAKYDGKIIGSFGHAAAFSFCQDKIISTGGEGGVLLLDDEAAYKKAWAFKDHGKGFDAVYLRKHAPGFRWLHESFGTNWRLTEMQSAIGLLQLEKLQKWVDARQDIAMRLFEGLKVIPQLELVKPPENIYHAYYRFYVFLKVDHPNVGELRDAIVQEISGMGVPCFVGSCGEIYKEKAFLEGGFLPQESLTVAAKLSKSSIAFLVHPGLDQSYVDDVVKAVRAALEKHSV